MEFKANPNINLNKIPFKGRDHGREEVSLLWSKAKLQTPLSWRWIVNELIFLLNGLRKEREFAVGNLKRVKLSGLSERQRLAIINETHWIQEECQLASVSITDKPIKGKEILLPDCKMSIDEEITWEGPLTWFDLGTDLVLIIVKFSDIKNKIEKVYDKT